MKRRYILIVLSFFVALVYFSSCDQSIDNLYTEKARIQFKYFKEDTGSNRVITRTYFDRTTFSFGMAADAVVKDTARVVVEYLGTPSDKDRTYTVRIGADSTTAVEGVHFEPFSATQTFRAGKHKDTLKIVVLRSNLSTSFTNPENRRIALDMETSSDFNLGMKNGTRTYLYINNYLSEPIWWKDPLRSNLRFYHPKKWKILISFNPKFADPLRCIFDFNNEGRAYFDGLSRYLNGVPTFDEETGGRIYMDRIEVQN